MKTHAIDDLLKVVSPELIAGYEAKNLSGKTLKAVNEEYKAANQQKGISFGGVSNLVLLSIPTALILSFYLLHRGAPTYVANLTMLIVITPPLYWYVRTVHEDLKKMGILDRCESIMGDFRQAVENLNPLKVINAQYTSDSVWGTLFLLSIEVLKANSHFKQECHSENPAIARVQKAVEWEQDCRKRFDSTFEASMKFGLGFTKARLYEVAQSEIEQRGMWPFIK